MAGGRGGVADEIVMRRRSPDKHDARSFPNKIRLCQQKFGPREEWARDRASMPAADRSIVHVDLAASVTNNDHEDDDDDEAGKTVFTIPLNILLSLSLSLVRPSRRSKDHHAHLTS